MKRTSACILATVLGLALSGATRAREPARAWRCLGDVRALARVGDTLYVGTGGGLVAWDLLREVPVDTMLGGGRIPSSAVFSLRAVGRRLFVGTADGVAVRERDGAWHAWPPAPARVPRRRIRSIDVAPDGRVFVSSFGQGVGVVSVDSSHTWTRADSLLSDQVFGVAVSPWDSTIYFATSMGLCARRDSVWVNFQAGAGIPRGEVRAIAPLPDDRYALLVGARSVVVFDGAFASDISPGEVFPEGAVADIASDSQGRVWAVGRFGDVASWSGGAWSRAVGLRRAVRAHPWRTVACDSAGTVFAGAADGTILRIDAGGASVRRIVSPLPDERVDRVVLAADGLWFRCAGRLWRLRAPADAAPERVDAVGEVADVVAGPDGSVWTCGARGVFRVTPGEPTAFDVDTRERDPDFRALAFDVDAALWVATGRGNVLRFDGLVWMRVGSASTPGGRAVRLVGDGEGGMWTIAPYGGPAAARFLSDAWVAFDEAAFDGERPVDAARAPSGVLVAATRRRLWAFDPDAGAWKLVHARPEGADDAPGGILVPPGRERFRALAFAPDGELLAATGRMRLRVRHGRYAWTAAPAGALDALSIAAGSERVYEGFVADGLRAAPRSRW